MSDRRVAITGIGWVTPLGTRVEPVWEALLAGTSGLGAIQAFDTEGFATRIAGEARDFDPTAWMDIKQAKRTDRFVQFAVAAGEMALQDAALDPGDADAYRTGVVVGSGSGGMRTIEIGEERLLNMGPRKVPPLSIPKMMINAASAAIASRYDFHGPSFAMTAACSTGSLAVAEGASLIKSGMCDVVLAGGAEASITPLSLGAFCSCGALSRRNDDPQGASRPFDLTRDGFVMAEGAGVLILEDMESARARGARIYAELSGWGLTNDAHHITVPHPSGEPAARAITDAISMAGASASDVDYINAHGTGTPLNDPAETHAIRLALDGAANSVAVSSTKSMLGHMLGATGAVEAGITALALSTGKIPPTTNVDEQDPACDLDVVPHTMRELPDLSLALSNSFAFGGHNVCLAMRKV